MKVDEKMVKITREFYAKELGKEITDSEAEEILTTLVQYFTILIHIKKRLDDQRRKVERSY